MLWACANLFHVPNCVSLGARSLKTTQRQTVQFHEEVVIEVVFLMRPSSKLGVKHFVQDEGPKTPVSVSVCLLSTLTNCQNGYN